MTPDVGHQWTDADDVLDAYGAAKHLGLHVVTVRRLAREKRLPAYKVGGSWRFNKSTLYRWAESQHAPRRTRRVLVVDDNEIIRDIFSRMLRAGGYEAETASTGEEALELMRRNVPDVVLLDLKMPVMDGPTTLKEIREQHGQVPVVIITAYPDSELMHKALRYCPFTMLAKPVTSQQLLEALRLVLGEGQEGATHATATEQS